MVLGKTGWAALMAAGLLALGGCTDGYGYSGVSVGAGYGGGYAPGYYGGGYGYAPSYYGWYNNFYYPGTGIYVYDRYRRAYPWNDGQRAYWQGRRDAWRGGAIRDQWRGWGRGGWRGPVPGAAPGWRGRGAVAPTPAAPRAEGGRGHRGTPGGWRGGRWGGGRGGRGPR